MPIPTNAQSLQHEGRLLLALEAFKASYFRSYYAATAAFAVDRYALDRRARGIPLRVEALSPCLKLTSTKEQIIV